MKEVVLVFALLLALVTSVDLFPVIGSTRKVALVGGGLEPEAETRLPIKYVRKHNLNSGQMKKMHWLRYVDKN